jgi:hypothetical protein
MISKVDRNVQGLLGLGMRKKLVYIISNSYGLILDRAAILVYSKSGNFSHF